MPRVPLYIGAQMNGLDFHGLSFYKFFNAWDQHWKIGTDGQKQDWLKHYAKSVGERVALEQHNERQAGLCTGRAGMTVTAKTTWRFVNGLGYDHPVENGLTWHHTLGVPYIPGSSVKGMVRSWALNWADQSDPDHAGHSDHLERVKRIFGTPKSVGSVIFGDAIPAKPVALEVDVMTPHIGKWRSDATQPPADWNDPTPIPFLAVAAETAFHFTLLPTSRTNQTDLETVKTWLLEALQFTGIGAKTAVGYGRMEFIAPRQAPEQTQADTLLTRIKDEKNGLKFSELSKSQVIIKYIADIKALPSEFHTQLRLALEARVSAHTDKKDNMRLIKKAFGDQ